MINRSSLCCLMLAQCFALSNLFPIFNFANKDAKINLRATNSKLILEAPLSLSGTLSLKDNLSATVSGQDITFVEGILETGLLSSTFTGTYGSTGTDSITLGNNDSLDVISGTIPFPITVTGSGAILSGRFLLQHDISLSGSGADLSLYLQNPLGKNINLNSGSVSLGADVHLGESVQIVGPGTINSNNNSLHFGAQPITASQNLTFTGQANIELAANLSLDNCTWTFSDVGGYSVINGNGNAIFLGSNGQFVLANGHRLLLNNVYLKGVGDTSGLGKIVFGDNLSELILRRSTIDLAANYTVSSGKVTVTGVNCDLLAKDFTLVFSGSSLLTIDGVAFVWDHLSLNNDVTPIIPVSASNLSLLNGGYIRSINEALQPVYIYSSSSSLSANVEITSASNLVFSNATPLVPKNIILAGNGHYIHFSRSSLNQNMILQDNIALTMSNVVLKDFNPASVSFGAGSSIIFGDDVILELAQDTNLDSSFQFKGNVTINGKGQKLTLSADDSIVLDVAGKNITFDNLSISQLGGPAVGSGLGRLRSNYSNSSFTFKNCLIYLDNDYVFSTGSMFFDETVRIVWPGKTLTYTSGGQSQILANSNLILDQGVTFGYEADIGVLPINGNSTTYEQSRNRFGMADTTAILTLDGATISCTATGIMLDTGTMIIKDKSTFRSTAAAVSEAPVLKNTLLVKILTGAILDLQGRIIYD